MGISKLWKIFRKTSKKNKVLKNRLKKGSAKTAKGNVGKVYRGRTKYIDTETKLERNYVVVRDNGKNVSVSKLKSIKKYDNLGKNSDKSLVEINSARYGLPKRTGVDFQKFAYNRFTKKKLDLSDKKVFPEGKERFKLGSHDLSRVLKHTKVKK